MNQKEKKEGEDSKKLNKIYLFFNLNFIFYNYI